MSYSSLILVCLLVPTLSAYPSNPYINYPYDSRINLFEPGGDASLYVSPRTFFIPKRPQDSPQSSCQCIRKGFCSAPVTQNDVDSHYRYSSAPCLPDSSLCCGSFRPAWIDFILRKIHRKIDWFRSLKYGRPTSNYIDIRNQEQYYPGGIYRG